MEVSIIRDTVVIRELSYYLYQKGNCSADRLYYIPLFSKLFAHKSASLAQMLPKNAVKKILSHWDANHIPLSPRWRPVSVRWASWHATVLRRTLTRDCPVHRQSRNSLIAYACSCHSFSRPQHAWPTEQHG